MPHVGLQTLARAPIDPELADLVPVHVTDPLRGLDMADVHLTSQGRVAVVQPVALDHSLIEARLTGRTRIEVYDSLIAQMLDSCAFTVERCRIGSIDRPDGTHRKPTEDGIRPCPLPGSSLPAGPSFLSGCDIINTDGRNGLVHMDGVQVWQGGNLLIDRCRIEGWWQAAVMLKSDWGPIDDVTINGCFLTGAQYFQLRIIDGGFGRPTNVTIADCVVDVGYRGGAHPINTGNDRCSVGSQTKYVRTEEERLDPEWVVYRGVVDRDGEEIEPRGGWFDPFDREAD